jgi:hypothetical protein
MGVCAPPPKKEQELVKEELVKEKSRNLHTVR